MKRCGCYASFWPMNLKVALRLCHYGSFGNASTTSPSSTAAMSRPFSMARESCKLRTIKSFYNNFHFCYFPCRFFRIQVRRSFGERNKNAKHSEEAFIDFVQKCSYRLLEIPHRKCWKGEIRERFCVKFLWRRMGKGKMWSSQEIQKLQRFFYDENVA